MREETMRTALPKKTVSTKSQRPRAVTVFAAAFVAGAAAAVGVNRALDVRLAQSKPRVESEAIFVALRSLPQGAAVTVWDVALRDWPKAMMPATALRANDTFSGQLLKHPLREGQPLLSIQLLPAGQGSPGATESAPASTAGDFTRSTAPTAAAVDADLWAPAEPIKVAARPVATQQVPVSAPEAPVAVSPVAETPVAETPVAEVPVAEVPVENAPVNAPVQEAQVQDTPAQASVPQGEPAERQELATTTDVAAVPESALPGEPTLAPEPVPAPSTEVTVATETVLVPSAPAPASPPTAEPAATTTSPTPPSHGRYLVVPESIALKADTSFVKRVDAQQPDAETTAQAGPGTASEKVRPLPPTAATARAAQSSRPQPRATQARPQQRQGRQTPTEGNGRSTEAQPSPQPRFGTTMFPNLSSGMSAVEGRWRRSPPEQGQAPETGRPVTAR